MTVAVVYPGETVPATAPKMYDPVLCISPLILQFVMDEVLVLELYVVIEFARTPTPFVQLPSSLSYVVFLILAVIVRFDIVASIVVSKNPLLKC